uniref:Uncharacterized protein n=1 Tax=Cyclopterus lumpus TaxID=8103 RepID=A0A8C3B211_CYCLU
MDRVTVVNYCLGLLGLLLLQGVLHVEGRSMFNPGKCERLVDTEMTSTCRGAFNASDLCLQLRALGEDLELERDITANLAEGKSITRKRGEPCFWKYCV